MVYISQKKDMLVLGIESSAHTFGVGIAMEGKVLANEKNMYPIRTEGMIPAKVAEFHMQNAREVVERALAKAGVRASDLDGIGYTRGPGLGPCLQVGMLAAKTLAQYLHIPIVPVNHGIGHIEIARNAMRFKDPVVLYVSGGNSQILKMDKNVHRKDRVLGETFDIGVGNMLDNFAREVKLDPAWGSTVAKMAEGGKYVELPYTVKGMDFSFTGLLTHAARLSKTHSVKDMCYSVQETAFAMLTEAVERALLLTNSRELCVCGGVAQSRRLKEMLGMMCSEHGIKFGYAADEFNADNGGMIAFVAARMLEHGKHTSIEKCTTEQRYRIDSAEVF